MRVAEKREQESKERISKLKRKLEKQRELSSSQQSLANMMDSFNKPTKIKLDSTVDVNSSVVSLHKTEEDSIALPEI